MLLFLHHWEYYHHVVLVSISQLCTISTLILEYILFLNFVQFPVSVCSFEVNQESYYVILKKIHILIKYIFAFIALFIQAVVRCE